MPKMTDKDTSFRRRKFLGTSVAGSVSWLFNAHAGQRTPQKTSDFLTEYGFWDYTTPGAGGMEAFKENDYLSLLDDMAAANMNSLMIYVKWLTTGYRSRLPFQDQIFENPVIASDNALLRKVIDEARKRRIKIWLGGAVTYFDVTKVQGKPHRIFDRLGGYKLPIKVGLYDTDIPGLTEMIVEIYEELLDLFPGVGGLEVELEGAGLEAPHRIASYSKWAKETGQPHFKELGHPLNPRSFDVPAWRNYTTYSRLKVLKAVEDAVRAKGFKGDLAMICETGRTSYTVSQAVNLKEFHQQFPNWIVTTYEYEKWDHRYSMMDVCIDHPKQEGFKVFYLPRGVMTWEMPLPISLEESWQMDLEDIQRFRPQGVWWFGSGTKNEGTHVSLSRLKQAGYKNGVAARQALLKKTSPLSAR